MREYRIMTEAGPKTVQGRPYIYPMAGRRLRLFIHRESEMEGALLSDERTGLRVGKIAPHLLAHVISTGEVGKLRDGVKKDRLGAAILMRNLIARVGAEKVLAVIDGAPSLPPIKESSNG